MGNRDPIGPHATPAGANDRPREARPAPHSDVAYQVLREVYDLLTSRAGDPGRPAAGGDGKTIAVPAEPATASTADPRLTASPSSGVVGGPDRGPANPPGQKSGPQ